MVGVFHQHLSGWRSWGWSGGFRASRIPQCIRSGVVGSQAEKVARKPAGGIDRRPAVHRADQLSPLRRGRPGMVGARRRVSRCRRIGLVKLFGRRALWTTRLRGDLRDGRRSCRARHAGARQQREDRSTRSPGGRAPVAHHNPQHRDAHFHRGSDHPVLKDRARRSRPCGVGAGR